MQLLVKGLHYRTSGSAQPFDTFSCAFDNVETLVGQRLDLGCRGYAIHIDDVYPGNVVLTLYFEDGEKSVSLDLGVEETIRHSQNILGVEITFLLK